MVIKDKIKPDVLQIAVNVLQPFIPELTPTGLVSAIKEYQNDGAELEKPFTRKQVAALLGVGLLTVSRYMNTGKLKRIRITEKNVRIDPESVRALLRNETRTEA